MLHPITGSPTCATAWLTGVQHLMSQRNEAYNLVVDIDDPTVHTARDQRIILQVDAFLEKHNVPPIATVANTIFPQDMYRRVGAEALHSTYLTTYDKLRDKGWGRYFQRMVAFPKPGSDATDQLRHLIERLRAQRQSKRPFHNVYEMTLFDPARDARRNMNRQCLSFLSFKLHNERGLMLTAMYRNHYYIARALGNFIGLGNLMTYIARSIEVPVGPLTCVSTHAVIDAGTRRSKADDDQTGSGWKQNEVRALIAAVEAAARPK